MQKGNDHQRQRSMAHLSDNTAMTTTTRGFRLSSFSSIVIILLLGSWSLTLYALLIQSMRSTTSTSSSILLSSELQKLSATERFDLEFLKHQSGGHKLMIHRRGSLGERKRSQTNLDINEERYQYQHPAREHADAEALRQQQQRINNRQRDSISDNFKNTDNLDFGIPIDDRVYQFLQDNPECRGKERPLQIAFEASNSVSELPSTKYHEKYQKNQMINQGRVPQRPIPALHPQNCRELPTWEQVVQMYGPRPIVYGLETCQDYRAMLQAKGVTKPMPRVAGLYHSGTNMLARTMELNFEMLEYYSEYSPYEIAWGKHIPPRKYRFLNTFPENNPDDKENILPVVIIRDPARWLRNMCQKPYDATFYRARCPQFVQRNANADQGPYYPVSVKAHQTNFKYTDRYESLARMWSDWYMEYFTADYPRIMIRYEDMLFHAKEVMQIVADCAGLSMNTTSETFRYQSTEARIWGGRGNYLDSLIKNGKPEHYYRTVEGENRKYVKRALHPALMETFHYGPFQEREAMMEPIQERVKTTEYP